MAHARLTSQFKNSGLWHLGRSIPPTGRLRELVDQFSDVFDSPGRDAWTELYGFRKATIFNTTPPSGRPKWQDARLPRFSAADDYGEPDEAGFRERVGAVH
jgi:hypothetical protein